MGIEEKEYRSLLNERESSTAVVENGKNRYAELMVNGFGEKIVSDLNAGDKLTTPSFWGVVRVKWIKLVNKILIALGYQPNI